MTDSSLDSDRIEILDKVRKFAEAKLQLSAFNPGESNVPVSGKVLDPEDFVALVDSSLDGWLTRVDTPKNLNGSSLNSLALEDPNSLIVVAARI